MSSSTTSTKSQTPPLHRDKKGYWYIDSPSQFPSLSPDNLGGYVYLRSVNEQTQLSPEQLTTYELASHAARTAAVMAFEVLMHVRPVAQLGPFVSPQLLHSLRIRSAHTKAQPAPTGKRHSVVLHSLHIEQVSLEHHEVVGLVHVQNRPRIVAMGIDFERGRHRCTEMNMA